MKVSIVGTGNLAQILGPALIHVPKLEIVQIFGRQPHLAQALAKRVQAQACSDWSAFDLLRPDLILLAVKDDALPEIAQTLAELSHKQGRSPLLAHCSGTSPSSVLAAYGQRIGIFYPLQTFSPGQAVNVEDIPFCVYSSNSADLDLLQQLAQKLSSQIHILDDAQRASLHLAAVFANNFSNFLWIIAEQICQSESLPFDLLRPLIAQTAQKVLSDLPQNCQTGPAKRGDEQTLARHRALLQEKGKTNDLALYDLLTQRILAHFGHSKA
jgi:predicted short-subunit dehydrogenase-like oxidoreductase (DUF2520 family)